MSDPDPQNVGRLMTAHEVAEILQRHYTTVLLLFREGKLAGYRFGGHGVRFAPGDVQAYLDAHRVESS